MNFLKPTLVKIVFTLFIFLIVFILIGGFDSSLKTGWADYGKSDNSISGCVHSKYSLVGIPIGFSTICGEPPSLAQFIKENFLYKIFYIFIVYIISCTISFFLNKVFNK
jgi:hypothetical protein